MSRFQKPLVWFSLIVVSAVFVCGLTAAGRFCGDPGEDPSSPPKKLKVLVLDGTPYNRGLVHGGTMKGEIHEVVRLWKAELASAFKVNADAFIRRFVRETDFVTAIKKWIPDLLEEVRGMAEGAGIDFDTMLVLQLPDEYFVNGEAIAREQ